MRTKTEVIEQKVNNKIEEIINFLEENSRGYRFEGIFLCVNVKQTWYIDVEDFIEYLKKEYLGKHFVNPRTKEKIPLVTQEHIDFIEKNLTEETISNILDFYIESEARFLVEDFPECTVDRDSNEWLNDFIDLVLDRKVSGLRGRMGGHYCFARTDIIQNEIDDLETMLESIKSDEKSIEEEYEEEEIDQEFIDRTKEQIKSDLEEVGHFLRSAVYKCQLVEKYIKLIEQMRDLKPGGFEELYFRIVEENELEFVSEDEVIEERLEAITTN